MPEYTTVIVGQGRGVREVLSGADVSGVMGAEKCRSSCTECDKPVRTILTHRYGTPRRSTRHLAVRRLE